MPQRKKRSNKYDKYDLTNPSNQPIVAPPPPPKLKKIAICGTACQGKSTLIKDMIVRWPKLTVPTKSYRDIVKEKGLTINKDGNEANQKIILDALVDQCMETYKDKVIFDRCPLDNLIYTLWLNDKYPDRMPDSAVEKTIDIVRESMKFLDVIFFIPLTSVHKVDIVEGNSLREVDREYIEEIDNLFKAVINTQKMGVGKFFPIEDSPPVIEVFGDRETRIKLLEYYIDDNCEFVGGDDSVINDLALKASGEYNVPNVITKSTK